jgi:CubicO group peptidase (beta-lactamase class C family)
MKTVPISCRSFILVFIIAFIGLIIPPDQPAFAQEDKLENLETYIDKSMAEWQIPGLAIAIVKDDQVIYNKGFGVRDIHKKDLVDENTQFAIASNTKAFTAHALGLLVQEGKISWDDPVIKYLPEFQLYDPLVTRKITIRDLLSHRSGLGTWAGDWVWWGSNYTREEMIDRIRFIKPIADFRTEYNYNNLMFLVAGQIIPEVTGKNWGDFLKERLFGPLNMSSTNTSIDDLDMTGNVAMPHSIRNDEVTSVPYVNVDISGPAGAINSSTSDMAQWLKLQLANGVYEGTQLIYQDIIDETRKSHIMVPVSNKSPKLNPFSHLSTYALGWGIQDYRARMVVNHTGGLDGMFSYLGFIPDENIGVVILTNLDSHVLMRALAFHVYDVLLNLDFQDWSKWYLEAAKENTKKKKGKKTKEKVEGTSPTHQMSDYIGKYTSRLYGYVDIHMEDENLKIRLFPHPNIHGEIEHWQYNTFQVTWSDPGWGKSMMYFDVNDSGILKQFRMSVRPDWIDTLEYTFVKME